MVVAGMSEAVQVVVILSLLAFAGVVILWDWGTMKAVRRKPRRVYYKGQDNGK